MKNRKLTNVLALIYAGADINATNNEGNTTLHIAVDQAEWPYKDPSWQSYLNFWSRSTPDVHFVELLLAFEADTSIKNKENQTPWEVGMKKLEAWRPEMGTRSKVAIEDVLFALHEVGAKGAMEPSNDFFKERRSKEDVSHGERHRSAMDKLLENVTHVIVDKRQDPPCPNSYRSGRLLSLDGGGIRGLVLTRMLLSIEKVLGVKTTECFDWIAGTSTGGIMALALASGKSVMDCQVLYMKMKDEVFSGWMPHWMTAGSTTSTLRTLLQEQFDKETKMKDLPLGDIKKDLKVFVTAAEVNSDMPDLRLLRNYTQPKVQAKIWCELMDRVDRSSQADWKAKAIAQADEAKKAADSRLVWEAARASSAAPTFFRPKGNFVDGGVLANNPSLTLLNEVFEFNAGQISTALVKMQQEEGNSVVSFSCTPSSFLPAAKHARWSISGTFSSSSSGHFLTRTLTN